MTTRTTSARKRRGADTAAAEPAPVLDPAVAALVTLSANVQRACTRQLRGLWREKKISERGLYVLELVNAGLDRPSRLIEYFEVLPSTITFETDKLVSAGLLTREADPGDRRVVRLKLTAAGLAAHAEATEAINAVLRPRLAALSDEEQARFFALFHEILDPLFPPRMSDEA